MFISNIHIWRCNLKALRKRAVLKIGSKSITNESGYIRKELLLRLAQDVKLSMTRGYEVIIVSSGAVTCGRTLFCPNDHRLTDQCYSMVGQPLLMQHWSWAFETHGLKAGQALFTNRALENEARRKSVVLGINDFLAAGMVPIVNENDAIITDEIKELYREGDNDRVAANLGIATEASHLVFLTGVPFVFHPETGKKIEQISADDEQLERKLLVFDGDSNGGMPSKVKYGRKFAKTGGTAVIKHWECDLPMSRVLSEMYEGTVIRK